MTWSTKNSAFHPRARFIASWIAALATVLMSALAVAEGPAATWVRAGGSTINDLSEAEVVFATDDPTHLRSYVLDAPINYSSDAPPDEFGPGIDIDDVFDQSRPFYFTTVFSGHLVIPPADSSNPTNTYTFAIGSDDGFRFRVDDGSGIESVEHDDNRAFDTGPLLTVTFPNSGGEFPFELLYWENSGVTGVEMSWAPGSPSSFDTSTFSLVPASQMLAPDLVATQHGRTLSSAPLLAGDELEFTVDLRNSGSTPAWDVEFEPQTDGYDFNGYDVVPAGATVNGTTLTIARIDPGERVEFRYTMDDQGLLQDTRGELVASTSPTQDLGTDRIRVVTNDPRYDGTTSTANRPSTLFPGLGERDDDPNQFSIGGDYYPPPVSLDTPSDGDQTDDRRPPVSGTSEPGAEVTIIIDGQEVATVTADPSGDYSWTPSSDLDRGEHDVEVYATDADGNRSDPEFADFTIVVPLTLDEPADGTITSDDEPTIAGTTAPDASVDVEIYDDGGNLVFSGSATVSGSGDWTIDSSSLADGDYTVTATATDADGNQTSASNDFSVDTTPPALSVDTPADGETSSDDEPTVSGTTEPGADVEVVITDDQGNVVHSETVTADSSGNWSSDSPALSDGDYTASATASDAAGNQTTESNDFSVDTTPPALTLDTPADGLVTTDTEPTVSGTTEPGADVEVVITDDQGNVVHSETVTADSSGDWSSTSPTLGEGDYTATATASDEAGNQASDSNDFTIDTSLPFLNVDNPDDGLVTNDGAIDIDGDTNPDATVTITIYDDSGAIVATPSVTQDSAGNFEAEVDPPLDEGTYEVEVTSTGANGQTITETREVTVDTTPPVVAITQPGQDAVTSDKTPTISGTTEPGAEVEVYVDGELVGTTTADADGDWSLELTDELDDGDHTVEAVATDEAGNEGASEVVDFTVVTDAPQVTITSPDSGERVGQTPTISGTAEPGAEVDVYVDGVYVGTADADADGNWSLELTDPLAEGEHDVEARVTDQAGNEGTSGTVTFEVYVPADVVITFPSDGDDVDGDGLTVEGTGEPGTEVTVTVGDQTVTTTVDEDGNWSASFDDVPEGSASIEVTTDDGSSSDSIDIDVFRDDDTIDDVDERAVLVGRGGCTTPPAGAPDYGWLVFVAGVVVLGACRRRDS